jgi:hypothetical protein
MTSADGARASSPRQLEMAERRWRRQWCGRPDLNRHSSFEPRDFLTTSAFAAAPRRVGAFGSFVVWTIPSPWRARALGAARLVSTPSRQRFGWRAWLGIACYRFPRIWAVLHLRFPEGHSTCFKSLASTSFATPAVRLIGIWRLVARTGMRRARQCATLHNRGRATKQSDRAPIP